MKEKKLFKAVDYIDDDLICEMLDYSPDRDNEEELCENIIYSAKAAGKRHYWRYPAAAVFMLGIVGTVLLIVSRSGELPHTPTEAATCETVQTVSETASAEAASTEAPPPAAADDRFSPYKAVVVNDLNVLFTHSLPLIPLPDLSSAQYTEMSTLQLCEYYGLEKIVSSLTFGKTPMSTGKFITYFTEVADETATRGIYTLPDGSVYDINSFTFETEDFPDREKRITVTVGKSSVFGEEYDPAPDYKVGETVYYCPAADTFFMIYEKYGSCIMISGKSEDLSDFDDPLIKEMFENEMFQEEVYGSSGVPKELNLFYGGVVDCLGRFQNITIEDWKNADPNERIMPDKLVALGTDTTYVLYTDKYPSLPEPDLIGAEFTEMTASQLFEYYRLPSVPYELENGDLAETAENTVHGIYTLPDGSSYDINTFVFETPDYYMFGKKFTVTVGRAAAFGEKYNQEPIIPAGKTVYYNEENKTFFTVSEKNGSYIMISANADELSDFDDPATKDYFYHMADKDDSEIWQGVPCEIELFLQNVFQCIGMRSQTAEE
ncbi:MAG: hypothetical protein NC203_02465 [Firmicutes bacterium]|nr:hypothetical protein [[Eubacterium] siraeum]MCM1487207.1 hypothetical protein [Bacillota bacterium]